MKIIKLTQNQETILDNKYYNILNSYQWFTKKSKNTYYAVAWTKYNNKRYLIYMHRFIMQSAGYNINHKMVDHINGNGLDNKLKNLRICTNQENQQNRYNQSNNKSGYKGVGWHKTTKKWRARISINNQLIHLGLFQNKIEAAKAYDIMASKHFGNFAKLNFPTK